MKFKEVRGDLFSALRTQPKPLLLAHCISADAALGAGIAKTFRQKYPAMAYWLKCLSQAHSLRIGNDYVWPLAPNKADVHIANLITKDRYWRKPTYTSLAKTLAALHKTVRQQQIKTLAIPRIGCGLDRLSWQKVSLMITAMFEDTDVTIIVYRL